MKQGSFNAMLIFIAFAVGISLYFFVFATAPKDSILHDLYQGGPLIATLIAMSIMVVTYIIERILSLKKANGTGSQEKFLSDVVKNLNDDNFDAVVKSCDKQRSSLANILKKGIVRYTEVVNQKNYTLKEKIEEVKRVIEETVMLEMPILERNLIALSTIASISTLVGLLGTVVGMIRSFAALARAGSPDAAALSKGISEALFNTAGGIGIAIFAIVAYNFFTTKIDGMTYLIDEASKDVVKNLESKHV